MWKKKREGVQKKKLTDLPCESDMYIIVEEHVSSESGVDYYLILLLMMMYYHQPVQGNYIKLFKD